MSARRVRATLAGVWVAAACAGGPAPTRETRAVPLPELAPVHDLAPDYVARVQAAYGAAAAELTPEGRSDQLQRAALLREAALVEAERIALTRQVRDYERRIELASAARARAERALVERRAAHARDAAALRERAEAARVFGLLSRAAEPEPKERDATWTFLLRRAQAVLAVAVALGAEPGEVERASLQLTAARTANLTQRVRLGRTALLGAHAALGSARARSAAASAAEQLDLVDRLHERGFATRASETGAITIELAPAKAEGDARLRFALLTELMPAFPHGPIVLTCGRKAAATYTGCAPSAWLLAERARVRVQPSPPELPPTAVWLSLPAYGPTAK